MVDELEAAVQRFIEEVTETFERDLGENAQFRVFDPQISGEFQIDWLTGAAGKRGVSRSEIDWMLSEGLIRQSRGRTGEDGFILYAERMAEVLKRLRDSRRYSPDELRHIADDWHVDLEVLSKRDLAYDSFEVDDYEHFRRHAGEMVRIYECGLAGTAASSTSLTPEEAAMHTRRYEKLIVDWSRMHQLVSTHKETELTSTQQRAWRRSLFQLRWFDDWFRIMKAKEFEALVEQGYSTEVAFRCKTWAGDGVSLAEPNWSFTLDCFKETINEGKTFPLRTPDFNITSQGVTFLRHFPPQEYQAFYQRQLLDQLFKELDNRGPDFWECDLSASGRGQCSECGAVFERTASSRKYCGERCRLRAKARRWREANPERAREAQARYYRQNYPESRS
jgi:hypothetical protein